MKKKRGSRTPEPGPAPARQPVDHLFDDLQVPLLVLNADLTVRAANEAFFRAYGLQAQEVRDRPLEEAGKTLWGVSAFKNAIERLARQETSFEEVECMQDQPGAGARTVRIDSHLVRGKGPTRIFITIHDVTAQREAERLMAMEQARLAQSFRTTANALHETEDALRMSRQELRALTGSLLHAQDEERRRVSRELHDDVSQNIVKLMFDLEDLDRALPSGPPAARQSLQAVRDDAARLSSDLRRIAYALHPSTLDNLGLSEALSVYASDFSRRTGIAVEFSAADVPDGIPHEVAGSLYRISLEALRNIVRHSGAAGSIRLTGGDSRLVLAIQDGGPGFNRDTIRCKGGLGLVSMEERARLINATFELATAPGQGVSIIVSAPLGA